MKTKRATIKTLHTIIGKLMKVLYDIADRELVTELQEAQRKIDYVVTKLERP